MKLTDEQITFYNENGCLELKQLTEPQEVEEVYGIYDSLFASKVGRNAGDQYDLAGNDENGEAARLPQFMTFSTPPVPLDPPRQFPWLEVRQAARQQRASQS